jgi:hypothetical protein
VKKLTKKRSRTMTATRIDSSMQRPKSNSTSRSMNTLEARISTPKPSKN